MHAPPRPIVIGLFSFVLLVALAVPMTRACDDVPFAVTAQLPVGGPSLNLLTADFNNDGKADLAVTNESQVVLFLGDGAGNFGLATTYNAGLVPRGMAIGDLDKDGRTDLVVVDLRSIAVLLNNGAGGFEEPVYYTAGEGPNAVGTGDFNGDGNTDVAVVNRDSDNVTVLLGNGTGGFDSLLHFPAGDLPYGIAIGDYDNDGKLDLAISTYTSEEVLILRGDGTGSFSTINSYPLGGNASRIIAGDFNHDQNLDLAVGVYNVFPNNHIAVFLGHGDGTFTESAGILAPDAQGLAAADFDGDGNLDLASTSYFVPSVVVALGDGTGSFAPPRKTRLPGHPYPFGIVTADFNSDGRPDLAISNFHIPFATILFNIATVQVLAADATASEADLNPGRFQVGRNGCLDQPQVVRYTVSGTARPGVDYRALSGSVTIPAGSRFASVPVIPTGQMLQQEQATVILTLDPDVGFLLGQKASATVVISNQ
ncbi:MAG: FG-GAP-like repeat-containing protein [Chthoniobacterales bacterium]